MSTDQEWEKWGKVDPYFAVITNAKFRAENLTQEAKEEFFEFGKDHVSHVLEVCRQHLDQGFTPKRALDFGCGTGRIVMPLAEIAEHVVGLDVSNSMLDEACKNCEERSISNVSFLKSDDNLFSLDGCFDFIHSALVFQHIAPSRGKLILMNLLKHLENGGIGAMQFTYAKTKYEKSYGLETSGERLLNPLKKLVKAFLRVLPHRDPEMQMNLYNLNELLFLIQSTGICNFYVEYTDHEGQLGVFLFFQKFRKVKETNA
ncbi:MAG: class I SAM-dependent methyltransferase [Tildeniella nuda ZEHNDER 1965/U140]|jgi:2-polyprenyl-3-methyl-5-hydroxy-6-metoxy-1,4-benzoquinol methylase|nr:class I SAM-dependent methyltransferase [Tildeniella nuda ZEHNDER 1965/U140]